MKLGNSKLLKIWDSPFLFSSHTALDKYLKSVVRDQNGYRRKEKETLRGFWAHGKWMPPVLFAHPDSSESVLCFHKSTACTARISTVNIYIHFWNKAT